MREKKFYTVKEWNKFKINDYDMQVILCQKYDVILTDYKTKREKVFSILKKINLKNLDKGVTEFSKSIQSFGRSMDQLTREIDSRKSKDADNMDLIWGKSNNSVPIWSSSNNSVPIWSSSENSQARYNNNLEKIWGKQK